MSHLTEDDLILRFYGEEAEPTPSAAHLSTCEDCRRAFESLASTLGKAEMEPSPERGEDYGRQVWQQIEPRLPAAPLPFPKRPLARRSAAVLAMAASLVLAFLLGRHLPREDGNEALAPGQVRERILLVALGDHLERSQMILVELVNADPAGPLDISGQRQWAEQLASANRLYRASAERAGEAGVASVLDELERVLLEVANAPDRLSPLEIRDLAKRIESRGLLFKVRVIGSRVKEREAEAGRTGGRTAL
jgi:hypothetical protein